MTVMESIIKTFEPGFDCVRFKYVAKAEARNTRVARKTIDLTPQMVYQ